MQCSYFANIFYFVKLCLTDYANVFDVERDVFYVQRRAIILFYAFVLAYCNAGRVDVRLKIYVSDVSCD